MGSQEVVWLSGVQGAVVVFVAGAAVPVVGVEYRRVSATLSGGACKERGPGRGP